MTVLSISKGGTRRRLASWLRRQTRWAMVALLAATVVAMVVMVHPSDLVNAMGRFQLRVLPIVLVLSIAFFALQGLRWHQLLREAGVRLRLKDSLLLNATGQAVTAVLPLGDLTRAVLASRVATAEFGAVAATVTVQELAYTLVLVLAAAPVLITMRHGVWIVVAVAIGVSAILAVLTVRRIFGLVHRLIAGTPLLRRLLRQIDQLHEETAALLHRPDTLGWSVLDAARAAMAVTALWVLVEGLEPGVLGWWQAAFVLALSYVGGAISMLPGGTGANEASTVGLLLFFGIDPATAAAAVILQRVFTTGMAMVLGWSAYMVVRRRLAVGSLLALRPPAAPQSRAA
jgi:uncharacterized protein (TIRG00374 family)